MNNNLITQNNPFKICFVCLGNICRSPTAEGIFQYLVEQEELQSYFYIDSAGTSAWHSGEAANSKSRAVANQHGVELGSRARRFEAADLEEFDLILAMDEENYRDILEQAGGEKQKQKVRMMREFDPDRDDNNVPDPYHGGIDGFEHVFQVLERSCRELLNELKENTDRS